VLAWVLNLGFAAGGVVSGVDPVWLAAPGTEDRPKKRERVREALEEAGVQVAERPTRVPELDARLLEVEAAAAAVAEDLAALRGEAAGAEQALLREKAAIEAIRRQVAQEDEMLLGGEAMVAVYRAYRAQRLVRFVSRFERS
jgi:hypothetical protein